MHSTINHHDHYQTLDYISTVRVDRDEVEKKSENEVLVMLKLKNLDTKKGAGLENIPPLVLHHCRSLFAEPLTSLFNESLKKGIFPKS